MHAHIHVGIYMYVHTYACIGLCMQIHGRCIHTCMHISMTVCLLTLAVSIIIGSAEVGMHAHIYITGLHGDGKRVCHDFTTNQ